MFIIKDENGVVINASEDEELITNTLATRPEGCTIEESSEDWQLINGEYRIGGKTIEEQNEDIRQARQSEYEVTSDVLFRDYQEALARGEADAEEKKQLWLASKDKVREENPYVGEVDVMNDQPTAQPSDQVTDQPNKNTDTEKVEGEFK